MPESLETVLVTRHAGRARAAPRSSLPNPACRTATEWPTRLRRPFVATVGFDGAHSGAVSVTFPASLLPVLAANILGEEESPSEVDAARRAGRTREHHLRQRAARARSGRQVFARRAARSERRALGRERLKRCSWQPATSTSTANAWARRSGFASPSTARSA